MDNAPPSLRSLSITGRYRSDREDVVQEFYVPVLSVATTYSRAVGYFTSTSVALFARGLESFAERGGKMRLIASPHLDYDDILDIERGYDLRAIIERVALRELSEEDLDPGVLNGLGLVGRLVAQEKLDIKLAFVRQAGRIGLYHEKIGVFRDAVGDLVAFTGSANETYGGLVANFESVEVYLGWLPGDGARALRLEADFDDLWYDRTPNLSIEPFPEVARDRLVEIARRHPDAHMPATDDALSVRSVEEDMPGHLIIPASVVTRDYQRQAIEAWFRNQGRGILEMATGTGKTKTAIVAATQLSRVLQQREEPLVIVVLAPYQHLVDQWLTEFADFGVRPIGVYESSDLWIPKVEAQLGQARLGQRTNVTMVATLASFRGDRFQSVLSRITQPLLIVADEVHNLGSEAYHSALPPNATYRLALSATPERWFDPEGTDALKDYFGPIVYQLGLGKAIEIGALCRYRYLPRLVELDAEETKLYIELTTQIAQRMSNGENLSADDDSAIGQLLRQRAGVLGHAEGKLARLRSDLTFRRDAWYQLVYCAEGTRPTPPGEQRGPNQLAEVMDLIGNQLGLAAHSYVAETPRPERRVLLRRFDSGNDLRFLVSMRCLDEGVDIPNARIGYLLASSTNPRQFIQRRGRLLRRSEGKDQAEIFDYMAVPDAAAPVNFDVERRLLARELERANEFGKLAENYEATLELLRPLKDKYQLMHL
jgi:DNA phosphorothioation system restriction enzyme